jgi:uncharacterized protein
MDSTAFSAPERGVAIDGTKNLAATEVSSKIRHMRSVTLLVVYLGVVFVGGGLLAPWLATGTSGLATVWPWAAGLADHPFHRYVHRSLLLMGVVGLWPLARFAGMDSWAEVGLRYSRAGLARLGMGMLTAIVVIGGVGLVGVLLGGREWTSGRTGGIPGVLVQAGTTGIVVGFLEELLFRGVLFGLLLRSMRLWPALIASSLIFAALHFLGRPPGPEELKLWSGLEVVGGMLVNLANGKLWIPAGMTLTLFGMLLAICYARTGDLFYSIGLHAGVVFALKVNGSMTASVAGSAVWFWGSKQWIDGWLAVMAMGMLWCACNAVIRVANGGRPWAEANEKGLGCGTWRLRRQEAEGKR